MRLIDVLLIIDMMIVIYLCLEIVYIQMEVVEHSSTDPNVLSSIPARSHTGVMDYDDACFMHLTPGVVHNFQKAA